MNKAIDLAKSVGMEPPFVPLGPFDMNKDTMGAGVAVLMVLRSLNPGRYGAYSQFDTIRKIRSIFKLIHDFLRRM